MKSKLNGKSKLKKKKSVKSKNVITQLVEKINNIDDRIKALEKELRLIREDILSGEPTERMRQRLLENPKKKKEELKKKMESEISFEI
jgi:hypothetical protein